MSTMKVWPLTEAGENLRHPHSHLTFKPADGGPVQPVEWPNDQFTFRRIQDGDITDKSPDEPKQDSPENSDGEKASHAKRRNLA